MSNRVWKVVVVDDTFDDLQIMATTLEYYAIEVYAASSVHECFALIEQIMPDLVITDLAMPDADGWAVLNAVRSNPQTAQTRVVAVTAYHSAKLADEVLRGGFDSYCPKPINPQDFIEHLGRVMQ